MMGHFVVGAAAAAFCNTVYSLTIIGFPLRGVVRFNSEYNAAERSYKYTVTKDPFIKP